MSYGGQLIIIKYSFLSNFFQKLGRCYFWAIYGGKNGEFWIIFGQIYTLLYCTWCLRFERTCERRAHSGCARFAEIWLKYFEFHILWSLSSVDFHTLTLQLPIQTQNSVAPELQAFVSSLAISAKRAHPRELIKQINMWLLELLSCWVVVLSWSPPLPKIHAWLSNDYLSTIEICEKIFWDYFSGHILIIFSWIHFGHVNFTWYFATKCLAIKFTKKSEQ